MKNVFYQVFKRIMRLSMHFYFHKTEIIGLENIPKDRPCIFSPNHQNAFLDALIIGCVAPIKISYLTRADVFNRTYAWFMDALQMIPIYRIRDGIKSLSLNDQIFEKCRAKIKEDRSILMFSEGNHGNEYYLRPLSKGSSRFALESQEMMPDKDILFIPVGLNYFHHQKPGFKVSIVFGEPIMVSNYFESYEEHKARGINALKTELSKGMKKCLLYPENDEQYEKKKSLINRKNEVYPFEEFRKRVVNEGELREKGNDRPILRRLADLISVINFGPLLLIRKVLTPIKDIVFKASLKYAIGLFGFPIWWALIGLVTAMIWDARIASIVILTAFLSLMLRVYLIRISNPHH